MLNELHVSKSGTFHLSLCTNLLSMYGLLLLNFDGMSRCNYKRLKSDWRMYMLFSHSKV